MKNILTRAIGQLGGIKRRDSSTVTVQTGSTKAIQFAENAVAVSDSEAAMTIATAWRCIRVLCEYYASLDLDYQKRQGKDGPFVTDENSPFHYLLRVQPQERLSAYDWRFSLMLQLLTEGNAYVYPLEVGGEITDLILLSPHSVNHDSANNMYYVTDTYNGVAGQFTENEIIHLIYQPSWQCQNRGVGPLEYAQQTMSIAATADRETKSRFASGGMVSGVLSQNRQGNLGIGDYNNDEMVSQANDLDYRLRNGERIVALDGEVDFKQFSMSGADMQFLETRKFSVREICRIYGVPPSLVYDDGSTNYKSAEMSNIAFLTQSLNPVLRRIELELTRKLIPRSLCCKRRFYHDRRQLYALDLTSMAQYMKSTIECGVYTVNDWREKENQPKVEGGDKTYISTNLAELGSEKLSGTPSASIQSNNESSSQQSSAEPNNDKSSSQQSSAEPNNNNNNGNNTEA